jgi:hypothetical protein
MMGKLTAASRKPHRRGMPPMDTVKDFSPQQGMRLPSAADKEGPEGGSEESHGMMEKADPVSTR